MAEDGKKKVDEAWKQKVESERQTATTTSDASDTVSKAPEELEETPYAPAQPSFAALINSLATQALLTMGHLEGVEGVETDLDQSRYTVDLLAMLQDKTKGNLLPEEVAHLEQVLHELRLAFVKASES